MALRTMTRSEFEKSRILTPDNPSDQIKIETLKATAIRALSNYMLYEGGIQDKSRGGKLGAAMDNYHERNVRGMHDRDSGTDTETGNDSGSGDK